MADRFWRTVTVTIVRTWDVSFLAIKCTSREWTSVLATLVLKRRAGFRPAGCKLEPNVERIEPGEFSVKLRDGEIISRRSL